MTAPVISFGPGWVSGDTTPEILTDLYLPAAGNIAYLYMGSDNTFATYDAVIAHTLTQGEIDALAFAWGALTLYNGLTYFRVAFNSETSNVLSDTYSGLSNRPTASTDTGGAWVDPKVIKAHDERKQRLKKNELALEQTIRLAHQRLSGKITEPEILKKNVSPQRLAVHAEKLANQLVEKSKNSARQRTSNKEIIADLHRQAVAIMQEEEEAIIMLLH